MLSDHYPPLLGSTALEASLTPSPVPLLLEWPPRTSTGPSLLLPFFISLGSHPSGPSSSSFFISHLWERVLICFSYSGWEGVKSVFLAYITPHPLQFLLLQACLPAPRWLDRKGTARLFMKTTQSNEESHGIAQPAPSPGFG